MAKHEDTIRVPTLVDGKLNPLLEFVRDNYLSPLDAFLFDRSMAKMAKPKPRPKPRPKPAGGY